MANLGFGIGRDPLHLARRPLLVGDGRRLGHVLAGRATATSATSSVNSNMAPAMPASSSTPTSWCPSSIWGCCRPQAGSAPGRGNAAARRKRRQPPTCGRRSAWIDRCRRNPRHGRSRGTPCRSGLRELVGSPAAEHRREPQLVDRVDTPRTTASPLEAAARLEIPADLRNRCRTSRPRVRPAESVARRPASARRRTSWRTGWYRRWCTATLFMIAQSTEASGMPKRDMRFSGARTRRPVLGVVVR